MNQLILSENNVIMNIINEIENGLKSIDSFIDNYESLLIKNSIL